MKISPLFLATMLSLLLVACSEETVPVSYSGLNNTDKSIVSIIVNGEGGVFMLRHMTAEPMSVASSFPRNGAPT